MPSVGSTIFRTITPATDTGLITIDRAKEILGIAADDTSHDQALTGLISAVSTAICNYCDRFFVVQVYRDQLRNPCFDYDQPVRVRQFPIQRDDTDEPKLSITMDGLVIDPSTYDVDTDLGRIYRINGAWAGTTLVLDYTGGFDPIPDDVQAAALQWTIESWMARGRDPAIKSEAIFDVMTVVYGNDVSSATSGTPEAAPPDNVRNLLVNYRHMYA